MADRGPLLYEAAPQRALGASEGYVCSPRCTRSRASCRWSGRGGGLLPAPADRLRVPVRVVEPEPWSLGVRLREQPENVRRLLVAPDAPADGHAVEELDPDPGVWISLVLRDGRLIDLGGDSALRAGDEVLLVTDPHEGADPDRVFIRARPAVPAASADGAP